MSDGLTESMKDFKNYNTDTTGWNTIEYHKIPKYPNTMTFAEAIGYIKGLLKNYKPSNINAEDLINQIKEAVERAYEIPSVNTPMYVPPISSPYEPPFEVTCETKQ